MPGQEGVWRHNYCNLVQSLSNKELCLGRWPSSPIAGETDSLTDRREVFLEDTIHLDELGDNICLLASYPGCETGAQELEMDRFDHDRNLSGRRRGIPKPWNHRSFDSSEHEGFARSITDECSS